MKTVSHHRIIYDDDGAYAEGHTAYQVLKILGYDFITDVDIDKNPQIISNYDRVILLHNEYATQNMFDAITSHPNVVYLYPGALSIKTNADYVAEQLLLVRGNGYPDASVGNGFDWEYDHSNCMVQYLDSSQFIIVHVCIITDHQQTILIFM